MVGPDTLSAYAHHFQTVAGQNLYFPGPWQRGRILLVGDETGIAAALKRADRWRTIALVSAFVAVVIGTPAGCFIRAARAHRLILYYY
jgi:hypothetical protein